MQSDNPKLDNWGNDIGDSKSRGTSEELEPNKWIQYTTTNGVSGDFALMNQINDNIVTIMLYENQTLPCWPTSRTQSMAFSSTPRATRSELSSSTFDIVYR